MAVSYIKPAGGLSAADRAALVPDNIRRGVNIFGVTGAFDAVPGTILVMGAAVITNGTYEQGIGMLLPGAYNSYQSVGTGHTLSSTFNFNGTIYGRLFFRQGNGALSFGTVSSSGASVSVGGVSGYQNFSGGIYVNLKPHGNQYFTCFYFGIMA